jgi:hypothetical protein
MPSEDAEPFRIRALQLYPESGVGGMGVNRTVATTDH